MDTQQLTNFIKNISSKYNIPVQELESIKDSVKDSIKDSVKATYSCQCGSVIKNEARGIKRHEKTKKHLEFIKNNEIPDTRVSEAQVDQTEQHEAEQPADEQPADEQPADEQPADEQPADEEDDESSDSDDDRERKIERKIKCCEICFEKVPCREFTYFCFPWGQFDIVCESCEKKLRYIEPEDAWYLQQEGDYLTSYEGENLNYRDINLLYGLHPREHINPKTTRKDMIETLTHYGLRVKKVSMLKKAALYEFIQKVDIEKIKTETRKKYRL